MDISYVAWIALVVGIIAAISVAVTFLRMDSAKTAAKGLSDRLRQREAELDALRDSKTECERALAVVTERGSRIPALETSLREAQDLIERLREEQASAERELSAKREQLSAKTESTERLDSVVRELRDRLAGGESLCKDLAERSDALKLEKAALESQAAEMSVRHHEKSDALDRLRREHAEMGEVLAAARSESADLRAEAATLREAISQERRQTEE
jgi:chromosome segregation ATPase